MARHGFSVAALALCLAIVWSARIPTQGQPAGGQTPKGATLVGASVCATCHQDVHDGWKSGRHSKMIQPASAASVEGDFSKTRITLRGQPFQLRVADGQYFITESNITGRPREHRVEYTLGSRRIQHYLTTIEKGRIIVLTPSWDVQRRTWFDNMEIVRPDENDQTPVQQWNKNCFGCHVSQQDNHYVPATQTYKTAWTDFGTTCERCHGPGSAHVERYRGGNRPDGDRAIVRPTRLDPKTSSMVCAQCHSLRDVVEPGYRRRRGLLRSLSAGARIRTAQGIGPDLLGRRAPAPFFERRAGSVAERVLPPRRRHLHELSSTIRTRPTSTRTRSSGRPATRSASAATNRSAARSPSHTRHLAGSRGQLLRRVPHAADGAEHQGAHPRSLDEPAGAGEHRAVRDSQRLQRMPHGQDGVVGGRHAREMVAAGTPREAGGARRRVHRRTRRASGGARRADRDRRRTNRPDR